jgi:PAS domain S-box-containing protein
VQIHSRDELGRIADSFNRTAEHLATTTTSIDNLNREITDSKKMGEELRESEQIFKTLFEGAIDGMLLANIETRKFYMCNRAMSEMLGYEPDEMKRIGIDEIHPKDALLHVLEQVRKLAAKEITIAENLPVKRKNGSVFYADIAGSPLQVGGKPCLLGIFRDITERKRVEEALRETNQYLDNLFNYANAPIIVWDLQFRITRFNHAFELLTGRIAHDVIGKPLKILFPTNQVDISMALIKKTLSGERWETVEIGILHVDGSVRKVLWNSATIFASDGKTPVAIIAQGHDITERKLAEEKLREAEGRFRIAAETSNDVVYEWDMQHSIQWFGKIDEMLGYGLGEFPRTLDAWRDSIYPEDRKSVMAAIQAHLEGRVPYASEYRVRRKDGNYRWWTARGVAIRTPDGHPIRWIGTVTDITERKRAEEALRETEARYKALFAGAPEGILVADLQTQQFRHANPAICRMFGYTEEEFLRLGVTDIHPKESLSYVLADFEAQARGEKLLSDDIPCQRKDGSLFYANVNAIMVALDGRKCNVGFFSDMTERQLAEQKQAQLLQELEKANQELKDFAYIVSHDLKAPLRAVKVLVDWLSTDYADKLDEDGKEQMRLLTKRVDRMHNLIDGILQYSRIGHVKKQNVNVDLNELVPEVIDLLAPPANITITTQANLPTVLCDKTRISQVFQNLLSNAVKFMDKPNGQVEVACVEENGFWKFSVADNGPGIEEQYFEKIFQMFQTLASRDDYESTGVGLTVAKKIVEMYGGKIWVESKVGHGSTFFFTLPKQPIEVKDEKLQTSNVS